MEKELDCRGLNCPEPVLNTKKALSKSPGAELQVIVDNQTARENVLRFVQSQGRQADAIEKEGLYIIKVSAEDEDKSEVGKEGLVPDPLRSAKGAKTLDNPVLFISTNELGKGSSKLGYMLMRNFIYTLTQSDNLPGAIVLMNSGVKLSTAESPVLEELNLLEESGVQVLVCGTCLDYFTLKEQQKAGQVSNMYDITDLLLSAERVITV